jgi:transcriptional regulator with XRE-family HTH domain
MIYYIRNKSKKGENQMKLKSEKVKKLIKEKGMNQTEFAQKMSVSKQSLNGWLSGERHPKMASVNKMAEILGTQVVEITSDFEDIAIDPDQWQKKAEKILLQINKKLMNDKDLPDDIYRKIMKVVSEEIDAEMDKN